MSEDPQQLRATIIAKYRVAEKGDYYGLLGVPSNAPGEEVRKAYFAMAKALHPDRVGRLGLTDLRPQASKLFQLVTEAYNTLSDPAKRRDYDAGKIQGATPTANSQAATAAANANTESAKIAYHKGSVMMQKRAYSEAEQYFREATDADDGVARYWQALGWAIFNDEGSRPEEQRLEAAKKAYERALELDAEDAQTHYSIGLYWKQRDDIKKMRRAMEKTLSCDPKHINAKRELRLLKMRQSKMAETRKTGGGGFFSNLWDQLTKKR